MKVELYPSKRAITHDWETAVYEVGKFFKKHQHVRVQTEDYLWNMTNMSFLSYPPDGSLEICAKEILDEFTWDTELQEITVSPVIGKSGRGRTGLALDFHHTRTGNLIARMFIVPCSAKRVALFNNSKGDAKS